jgi:hypothetical protein
VLFFGYFLFAQAKESDLLASTTPWLTMYSAKFYQWSLLSDGAHILLQGERHLQRSANCSGCLMFTLKSIQREW